MSMNSMNTLLTLERVQTWIQTAYHDDIKVTSLQTTPMEQGVMSQVLRVDCAYKNDNNRKIPSSWIVKICKSPDLQWMMEAEAAFYQSDLAVKWRQKSDRLFDLAHFLVYDDTNDEQQSMLVLEYVPNCTCPSLEQGCTDSHRVSLLLQALAQWHAYTTTMTTTLSSMGNSQGHRRRRRAGMGQGISGLQLEGRFHACAARFLERIDMHDNIFATSSVQRLQSRQVREISSRVHATNKNNLVAWIHGDYHVANWLFPTTEKKHKPVLLDWATSGWSTNPLIDVCFFLVVSTSESIVQDCRMWVQEYYHSLLQHYNTTSTTTWWPTLDDCWHQFGWTCLHQWTILMAYDDMCMEIAQSEPDPGKRRAQMHHFETVNRRMMLLVQACFCLDKPATSSSSSNKLQLDDLLNKLPVATKQDVAQAIAFDEATPLII